MRLAAIAALVLLATPIVGLAAPVTMPTGLNPGDQYRLAFLTSTRRNATSSDVADYNAFVSAATAAVPELLALGTTWTAIVSTSAVDARDNTGSSPGSAVGVPIYLLNDSLLAGNNADLWDGSIAIPLRVTEAGVNASFSDVWTGTNVDGTAFAGGLGSGTAARAGRNTFSNTQWIGNRSSSTLGARPVYALSGTLVFVAEPGTAALLGLGLVGLSIARRRTGSIH